MPHPLDDPHAKLARAGELSDELADQIAGFLRSSPPFVASQVHQDGVIRVVAEASSVLQPETSVIFPLRAGEIIQHLRSALDHVVHQLFLAHKLNVTTKTGFPIFGVRKAFEERAPSMIDGIPDSALQKIRAVQPFERGNDYKRDRLWILHTLNNTDKHRLIPVSVISGGWLAILFPERERPNIVLPVPERFNAGTTLCEFPDPCVLTDPHLVPMFAFRDVDGNGDVPILPFVRDAMADVRRIVETFAAEFSM